MPIIRSLCFLIASAVAAQANDTIESRDIPVEEWRKIALGKTLTYRAGGAFFALERYAADGNRVEIQITDGTCLSGTWYHTGSAYCYAWEASAPVCFRHFRASGSIVIVQVEDGEPTSNVQTMTHISEAPLSCGMNLS